MHLPGIESRWLEDVESAVEFVTLIDGDDRLLYVNHPQPGAEDYAGRPVFDYVAPAFHEALRSAVSRAKATGMPHHFSSHADGPKGEVSVYSNWVITIPLLSGVVAIIATDVTNLGRVEAELELSESTLRSLVDNMPDALLIVDRERRIQFVNRLEHGFEPDSVLGIPADSFVPEPYRSKVVEAVDHVLSTGRTTSYETLLETPNGVRRFSTRAAPIPIDDRIDRVMLVATDITAEFEAEQERLRLTAQLEQAQKMEAIGQLTGGVAHDFNNLLTAIGGSLELARLAKTPAHQRDRCIDQAIEAVDRAAELTKRLLAFSRKQVLSPQVIDLGSLVNGMQSLLQRTLGETLQVRSEVADDLMSCEVDPAQLEVALLNLAVNARDAMPRGGGLLIRCSNVPIDSSSNARGESAPLERVLIEVIDEGIGMTAEVAAQAFEPFFTTKEVGEGSGLGLSMVYGFVSQSGGDVRIESLPGRGTAVEVLLPAVPREAPPPARPAPGNGIRRGDGQLILVVEDDPQVRALITRILQGLGYRTTEAERAESALERLAEAGEVALVVSDIVLPGEINGFELAERLRTMSSGAPVLFISGYPDAAFRYGGAKSGVHEVLRKPFTIKELASAVDAVLAQSRTRVK